MAVASKNAAWMKAAVVVACCGMAFSARADLPPAMDKAPEGAMGVIAIRNLGVFHDRIAQYVELFEMEVEGSPLEMMDQLLSTPGMSKDGSAMVVMLTPGEGGQAPRHVVVAPVSDVKSFGEAIHAQGTTVMSADFGEDKVFMKDVGSGYLVMGPDSKTVEDFKLGQGATAGLKKLMGPSAFKAADKADVVVYLTPALVNSGMAAGRERMKEQAEAMAAAAGPGAAPVAAMEKAADSVSESFERDGQAMVMTLGADDNGIVFDVVSQFKDASPASQKFQIEGHAANVGAALPEGNMLLSGSIDTSSPLVKSWMREAQAAGGDKAMPGPWGEMLASIDKVDGIAMTMGVPPAGLMGGLLTASSTYIQTKDPAGLVAAMKAGMEKMNGQDVAGSKIQASYKPSAVEAGGTKVDSWQLIVPVDGNDPGAMNVQQAQMMLFGMAPGPSGLVGATDNGLVMTMGNNSLLMGAALQSAKTGKGQATQELVSAVRSRLPEDRVFEMYIGVKGIIDMVGPFLAMQTGGAPLKSPDKLSPVAFAGTMNGGAFGMRIVLPRDVLKTVADIMAEMKDAGEGDEPEMDGDAPEGENRPPRF